MDVWIGLVGCVGLIGLIGLIGWIDCSAWIGGIDRSD